MKIFGRILALFCILAILLSSFSSCAGALLLSNYLLQEKDDQTNPVISKKYAYTLSEDDRKAFLDDLDDLKALILEKRSSNQAKINAAIEKLDASYYHIATQSEIAYIYHCLNQADAEKGEAYLYASKMQSDLYAAYEAVCKEIDASDAPGKDIFFADWSEDDLEEMRGYSEEHTQLVQENDRIVVEYRSLTKTERTNRAPELYLQIIQNNNRIAALYHYESYPAYAYSKVYGRDYAPADAQMIHRSVKSTLLSVCQTALSKFQQGYASLNTKERELVRALLEGEYTDAWSLIRSYFSSFPAEVEQDMLSLFETDHQFLTSSQNADTGAFTTYLYDYEHPVCYFGPGYHDGFTVLHELGHYLSALSPEYEFQQMDLNETQSQANEWLFTAYLQQAGVSRAFAETVFYYQLHSSLQTIVLASIIDEFEQSIYSDPPEDEEGFDLRMSEICQGYGGLDWVKKQFTDPMRYWRNVALESPCYYISYAFSMLAAINFYLLAVEDYGTAQSAYLELSSLLLADGDDYCEWLIGQNLQIPFEESYYQSIAGLVD